MWWCTVFECVQQEAKLLMRFLHREAKCFEHFLLNITLIDPHRTAAYFVAVQYKVICLCTNLQRIFVKVRNIFFTWTCERMVQRYITFRFLVILQKWEVHHPSK